MGVPALFRWLSRKYPKIISAVLEEDSVEIDGITTEAQYSSPNPNGELDNLYLDMNGIVHPCSHPENKPPPETEDEMLLAVFEYTSRVVMMARPRKVLYIAVDGVAPRAKMNQQRARRFRSAKDAQIADEERAKAMAYGELIEDSVKAKKTWDSNAITPGTPFMDKLALALRYWTAHKLATDPGWKNVHIIISDATVPGEGEHKIMNFVRSQRSEIGYDPNTKHAIYGLDADLIFLGLATHEPHFRVLREDVFAQDQKSLSVKAQINMTEEEKQLLKERDSKKPFLWLNINVLREYLEVELNIPRLSFKFDLERAIDDWVFMCFFCGNDFLPHLPSLDVRDNSINMLVDIWKNALPTMKGYITCDGKLNLENVQILLNGLAPKEDDIFKRRQQQEERREENDKRRKLQRAEDKIARNQYLSNVTTGKTDKGTYTPVANLPLYDMNNNSVGQVHLTNSELVQLKTQNGLASLADKETLELMKKNKDKEEGKGDTNSKTPSDSDSGSSSKDDDDKIKTEESTAEEISTANEANISAAQALRQKLLDSKKSPKIGEKRPLESTPIEPADLDSESDQSDPVRLYEPGYRDRYYQVKFHVSKDEVPALRSEVVKHYIEGISWVLLYYYQGCPSWNWYYPYHYAPFASDFENLSDISVKFEEGEPFLPYEQLMSVLPAASGHNLPPIFRPLMSEEDSPIIDFYPKDFPIDMNGKKMSWQGIVLLPFIDEKRLLKIVKDQYKKLTDEERSRNVRKQEVLFISNHNPNYNKLKEVYGKDNIKAVEFTFNKHGLAGKAIANSTFEFDSVLPCPVSGDDSYTQISTNAYLEVDYEEPKRVLGKSIILTGYIKHLQVLTQEDKDGIIYGNGRGYHRNNYNNKASSDNIIKTGPGYDGIYKERYGGFKGFLKLWERQRSQQRQQDSLQDVIRNGSQGFIPSSGNPPQPHRKGTLPAPSRNGYLRR